MRSSRQFPSLAAYRLRGDCCPIASIACIFLIQLTHQAEQAVYRVQTLDWSIASQPDLGMKGGMQTFRNF